MAQDSEKKFHSIMDKLFHSPPALSSSSPGSQSSRGRKRPNPVSALALVDPKSIANNEVQISRPPAGKSQAPECRPWDRGDLMRRLSTFKSMTWFAKSEAVSAVNCARRGWVNVDMDTIACEACGARVLFSSPSSWSREQVEKAALVFSLKLDNGHKSLCPWSDNACDESLAQFPPTPPPVLVDQFKQRYISLSQLSALPVISFSAIKSTTSPQLENFLRDFSMLKCGNISSGLSLAKYTGDGYDQDSATAIMYYQAIKLISLCGWEPRSLPYMVISNGTNISDSPCRISNKESTPIYIDSTESSNTGGTCGNDRDSKVSLSDPQSVVLECKLCGASAGLWAFTTVPRPLEILRLVGFTELDDGKNSSTHESVHGNHTDIRTSVLNTTLNGQTPSNETPSNLNLSIAGGPPPTQQNFKATISLPVIGRNIIARLFSDVDLRSRLYSVGAENCSHLESTTLCEKNKESTEETGSSTSNQQSPLNPDITVKGGIDPQGTSESDTFCSQEVPLVAPADDNGEEQTRFEVQTHFSTESSCQERHGDDDNENRVHARKELVAPIAEKITKHRSQDEGMHFDPFGQHRHFCPWISTTGGATPGWQHTLSALHREKDSSNSVTTRSPSSESFMKVDDPVTSVRRLFTSKRLKSTHGTS